MIIKKKLYSWLSKFKPGVKFYYYKSLTGNNLAKKINMCYSYPIPCGKDWKVMIDNNILLYNYIYFERYKDFKYKPQDVIKFENDSKEEN